MPDHRESRYVEEAMHRIWTRLVSSDLLMVKDLSSICNHPTSFALAFNSSFLSLATCFASGFWILAFACLFIPILPSLALSPSSSLPLMAVAPPMSPPRQQAMHINALPVCSLPRRVESRSLLAFTSLSSLRILYTIHMRTCIGGLGETWKWSWGNLVRCSWTVHTCVCLSDRVLYEEGCSYPSMIE
jgi:hypothetical protein